MTSALIAILFATSLIVSYYFCRRNYLYQSQGSRSKGRIKTMAMFVLLNVVITFLLTNLVRIGSNFDEMFYWLCHSIWGLLNIWLTFYWSNKIRSLSNKHTASPRLT